MGVDIISYLVDDIVKDPFKTTVSKSEMAKVYRFDYRMYHLRSHRSKSMKNRTPAEKHDDDIRGKIAEFAVRNMFDYYHIPCKGPNTRVWDKGADNGDLTIQMKDPEDIEVKSTKSWGKCLLLEYRKWTYKGNVVNHDHLYNIIKSPKKKRKVMNHKQIPFLFVAVNVNDKFTHFYKTEERIKKACKNNKDEGLALISKYAKPIDVKIMGLLSRRSFIKTAGNPTHYGNLFSYIPTSGGEFQYKSDVPNFAYPYSDDTRLLDTRANDELNKKKRNYIEPTYPVDKGMNAVVNLRQRLIRNGEIHD